jgi:hypothetical protein
MKSKKPKKAKAPSKRTRAGAAKRVSAKVPSKPADAQESAPGASVKRAAPRKGITKSKATSAESKTPSKAVKRTCSTESSAKSTGPAKRRSRLAVPPILLEDDTPSSPLPSGPGDRYVLATAVRPALPAEEADLPEAYGTERLMLVARDPHWLYAHWDMTSAQLREHNAESRDGHLIVRVFQDEATGSPLFEQHVHPESRNWFLHVGSGGTKYVAQLGCYDRAGSWKAIATSGTTITPPDILSEDTSVRFETIPIDVPFSTLIQAVKAAVTEHVSLVEAIQELREAGYVELPEISEPSVSRTEVIGAAPEVPRWTPQQERALAEVISIDEVRRVWMGSMEITELIRRQLEHELASQAAAELAGGERPGAERPGGVFSISSPFGGEEQRKGFWFNVNAELIIYGRTEPDATVTIGGRQIRLRNDGTFSFRFALPDGSYHLPVRATSGDGDDSREAQLHFWRATEYRGDVGPHPQDVKLKKPHPENVA